MADARIWIALAALLVLAAGCLSRGINSAFAPLCAVGGTVLWFTLWGCFGLLQLGGYLYYVLVVLVLALLVYRHGIKRAALPRVGAGFWFFAATSVVAMLLLAHSQPQFISWDEFSLWGTAVKLTKLYNQTYSAAPVGWGWPATHPPAFINMGYFFQFFGAGFAPWQVHAAGNVFQFAALAALLYPFEKRGWNAAVPLSIAALLVPYLLVHYTGARIPSPVYMTALPDIACGLWFAAGLACGLARPKTAAGMVPLCICLAMLTLTKDLTGLLLALVVVGVLLLDAALGGGAHKGAKAAAVRVLRRCAAPLASVLAAYMGWSVYLGATLQVDRTNLGGTGEFSMFAAPFVFFKDLFAPVKSEYFTTVTGGMVDTFFKVNTTLLGTGA
ncbi:hypothetical protein LJC04_02045, partial [Ruminococcaceae bacterium OttesenSCG-928-O06]|nr:hypothetical protein [Ruminococcaceae bacterium OttesenSCG-928-O06]